jgi:hypothetical protein
MTAPAAVEPAPAPPNRLPLILGVGVALILGLFVLSKVAGGGKESAAPATPVTVPPAAVPTTTTPAPGAAAPPETFEVFTTKNPFQPLRTAASATTSSDSSTSRSGSASAGSGSTSGSSEAGSGARAGSSGSGTGTSTGTAAGGGRTEPARGERVVLLEVFTDKGKTKANVQVDDTVHKVGAGEVFATSYKVVSLSQSDGCGRFLFGDDQFRLCKGEEVIK